MKESYVMHTEYIEDLPEENKAEFLLYIYNFATKGIEPELDSFAKTVWLKIKRRMEYDFEAWENTKTQRSESGKIGGLRSAEARRSKTKQNEAVLQNGEANEATLQTVKQTQANEAVSVSVSVTDTVNESVTDTDTVTNVCSDIPDSKNMGKLQQDLYSMVSEHNKTAPRPKKVPISGNFWNFTCKESRELLSNLPPNEPLDRIRSALQNFLTVAKSDTWFKSFTWRTFCKHYVDFTPDYFVLSRYLNSEPNTDDATKRPENVFFFANKDDPRFKLDVFQKHIQDWKEAGRPEGTDYYRLQSEWEVKDAV